MRIDGNTNEKSGSHLIELAISSETHTPNNF